MKLVHIMKTGLLTAKVSPKELRSAIRGFTPAEDWLYMYSYLSCEEGDFPSGAEDIHYKPGVARLHWNGQVPDQWVGANGNVRDCRCERRVLIRMSPHLSFWLVASCEE